MPLCCQHYPEPEQQKAVAASVDFRSRYWQPSVCQNGKWIPTTADDYGPDLFSGFITDFVERNREQPFFIYYPTFLTHGPWLPTPDSYQPGEDRTTKNKAHFKANVEYMDKIVGRIVDALKENSVDDNTIVFFTGDNGTGGDGKSTATELGARVPLIVHGPSHLIQQRGSTPRLADMSDIFPTLMDFAGVSVPEKHVVDGRSLAPFLRGESEITRDWIFAYQADFRILRTERWLLEENSPRQYGRLWDCGEHRNGTGYQEVTDSTSSDVVAAKAVFDKLLQNLPAPFLDHDGRPNDPAVEQPSETSTSSD